MVEFRMSWTIVSGGHIQDVYFWNMQLVQVVRAAIQERVSLLKRLGFLSLIGIGLLAMRVVMPVDRSFLFLLWNFFLATVPLLISMCLRVYSRRSGFLQILPWLLLWLVFFPNAPYMLTDYRHLQGSYGFGFIIDFLNIFYFAIIAFIVSVISLSDIRSILVNFMGKWSMLALTMLVILSGFGVFIGRDMRYNSWDLFSKPGEVMLNSFHGFFNFHSNYWTVMASGIICILLLVAVIVYDRRDSRARDL